MAQNNELKDCVHSQVGKEDSSGKEVMCKCDRIGGEMVVQCEVKFMPCHDAGVEPNCNTLGSLQLAN
jgi:hypothetical protein